MKQYQFKYKIYTLQWVVWRSEEALGGLKGTAQKLLSADPDFGSYVLLLCLTIYFACRSCADVHNSLHLIHKIIINTDDAVS